MKQSRKASLSEAVINTGAGFGLSLFFQWLCLPLLGVSISFTQNLVFAVIMTFVSIGRGYALRRLFEAMHLRHPLSAGALAVIAERRRQIEQEGWTVEHDVEHPAGQLARAGATYALLAGTRSDEPSTFWPWDDAWWKPTDFRRDLIKACALIMAELDRMDIIRKRGAKP